MATGSGWQRHIRPRMDSVPVQESTTPLTLFKDYDDWYDVFGFDGYFDRILDIVSEFLDFPKLRSLEVSDTNEDDRVWRHHEISDLCCRARLKRKLPLFVKVLEVVYLV